MRDDRREFTERINLLIGIVGSARQLGKAAGTSDTTIRKYSGGVADPSRTRLVALARATGVSVLWLASGEGPMFPAASEETGADAELEALAARLTPVVASRVAAMHRRAAPEPERVDPLTDHLVTALTPLVRRWRDFWGSRP